MTYSIEFSTKLTLRNVPINIPIYLSIYVQNLSKSLLYISYYEHLSNHKAKKKVFLILLIYS